MLSVLLSVTAFADNNTKTCRIILTKFNAETKVIYEGEMVNKMGTLVYKNFYGNPGEEVPPVIATVQDSETNLRVYLVDNVVGPLITINQKKSGFSQKIEAYIESNKRYAVFNDKTNRRVTVQCE